MWIRLMIPLLHNSVVQSVVTFSLFAWLGSMNPANRNWLKSVAGKITGVKLPQLADNCNKQAVRRATAALNHPSATYLRKVKATFLEVQQMKRGVGGVGGLVSRVQPDSAHSGLIYDTVLTLSLATNKQT